jgi:hypothetical protein
MPVGIPPVATSAGALGESAPVTGSMSYSEMLLSKLVTYALVPMGSTATCTGTRPEPTLGGESGERRPRRSKPNSETIPGDPDEFVT